MVAKKKKKKLQVTLTSANYIWQLSTVCWHGPSWASAVVQYACNAVCGCRFFLIVLVFCDEYAMQSDNNIYIYNPKCTCTLHKMWLGLPPENSEYDRDSIQFWKKINILFDFALNLSSLFPVWKIPNFILNWIYFWCYLIWSKRKHKKIILRTDVTYPG